VGWYADCRAVIYLGKISNDEPERRRRIEPSESKGSLKGQPRDESFKNVVGQGDISFNYPSSEKIVSFAAALKLGELPVPPLRL
jgi:hypothetical protein